MKRLPVAAIAIATAAVVVPTGAWKSLKGLYRPADLAFEAPNAFIEGQWGTPYVDVPGKKESDGAVVFVFSNAVDGVVAGYDHKDEADGDQMPPENGEAPITPPEEPTDSPTNGNSTPPERPGNSPGICTQEDASAVGPSEFAQKTGVKTYEECRTLCLENRRCNWQTYNTRSRICYMKGARGGNLAVAKNGDITAPKFCDSSCYQKDTEISGTPIATFDDCQSAYVCHHFCYTTHGCEHWNWSGETKQCAVYGGGEQTQERHAEGFWSGTRRGCGSESAYAAGPGNTCTAPNVGASMLESEVFQTITQVTTVESCQEACRNTMECKAALFDEAKSSCELMRKLHQLGDSQGKTLLLPACGAECFKHGQKLSSEGAALGFAPDAYFCQALCQARPNCNGFTWQAGTGACTAHGNDSDLIRDWSAVSGPRQSCTANRVNPDPGSCDQMDISADISVEIRGESNVAAYEDCRMLCLENDKCNWLTYNAATKTCHLKTSRGALKFYKKGDRTSPKLCDSSCFQKDIELGGTTIDTIPESLNAHHCHYECFMNKQCQFWSWNVQSKECTLRGITAGLTGRQAEGFWSGSRGGCGKESNYVGAPNSAGLGIVKYADAKTDYYVTFKSVETLEKCLALCEDEKRCALFRYDAVGMTCQLSDMTGVVTASTANVYLGKKTPSTSCYRTNYALSGDNAQMVKLSTVTAAFCQAACEENSGCQAFVWNEADKDCVFKAASEQTTGETREGFVSGPREACYTKPVQKKRYDHYFPEERGGECKHRGVTLDATPLTTQDTEDLPKCLQACSAEHPRCEAYVWDDAKKKCTLFGRPVNGLQVANEDSYLGVPHCDSSCFYEDYEYAGQPMDGVASGQTIATPHECQLLCRSLGECYAWTYSIEAQSCRLFTPSNALVLQPAAKVLSGRWGLCKEEKKVYDENECVTLLMTPSATNELALFGNVSSIGECARRCRENDKCTVMTYNRKDRLCYLKGLFHGHTDRAFDFGDQGATRECSRDCHMDDVRFAQGKVVKSTRMFSVAYCQALCVATKDTCAVWSYNRSTKTCELRGLDGLQGLQRKDNGGEGWISGHNHFCF